MMKRFLLIALLIGMIFVPFTAFAEDKKYVIDGADLLTEVEEQNLNIYAASVSERYECDVYVAFMEDMEGCKSISDYSEYLFDKYDMGYGSERNMVLLTLVMSDRLVEVDAYGPTGHSYFTDNDKEWVLDDIIGSLSNGDYYGAAKSFVEDADYLLSVPLNNNDPYPVTPQPTEPEDPAAVATRKFGISAVIAAIGSFISTLINKGKMKNTGIRTTAHNYASGGVNYRHSHDYLVDHRRSVRVIPRSTSSSGGSSHVHSGSTHVSSSGHSHSSSRHF